MGINEKNASPPASLDDKLNASELDFDASPLDLSCRRNRSQMTKSYSSRNNDTQFRNIPYELNDSEVLSNNIKLRVNADVLNSHDISSARNLPNRPSVLRNLEHNIKSGYKLKKIRSFPCLTCKKTFDRPSLLIRHIRVHTGEKPFSCEYCAKCFSTTSSLNTHIRIHTGEKPHACFVCGKNFTASSNLYYHKMTHIKIKPHKCKYCDKSFATPGDLKSHSYTHTGNWPLKCKDCHKGFSKMSNLRTHMALHNNHFKSQNKKEIDFEKA
ncbi:zinc finger protein 239-like [Gordionus sp. m RMFG-2023]|uniref:zinc finger protein 239-like n=1 Tax=Gordionus sp. m RMFG-2023 TaxID=3053472 RepID=UPI0031FDD2DD